MMTLGEELPPHPKVSLQQGCASAVLASLDTSLEGKDIVHRSGSLQLSFPYRKVTRIYQRMWHHSHTALRQR